MSRLIRSFVFSLFFAALAPWAFGKIRFEGEAVSGDGVWVAEELGDFEGERRVTVWFDRQFLGDGEAYERRAKEFAKLGRRELRAEVMTSLKELSEVSFAKAEPELKKLLKGGEVRNLKGHWIVNGFSCMASAKGIEALAKVAGVKKIFASRSRSRGELPKLPPGKTVKPVRPEEVVFEELPWYLSRLQVEKVWKELAVTGEGTLNVVHDGNFVMTPSLARTVYVNAKEVPNNGKDDDGNGLVDDVHGFNFIHGSSQLSVRRLKGDASDRRALHGTSCAQIICGAASEAGGPQFGMAPMSRWAGVIASAEIEAAVEWAIEQGTDTYSMSFSRPGLGETRSHWRKLMEHGSFCGVFFVSGAGNFAQSEKVPVQMRTPEDIPNAVFAAAGVQKDLSRTPFSSKGPVLWETEHYGEGLVQKPLVCAFNYQVPLLMPDESVVEGRLNGNSFAGPMFCGAISLMLSADPDLLPWDLREIITSTATDVAKLGVDDETGYGLINCYAAVKEVLKRKKARGDEGEKEVSKIEELSERQLAAYNAHDLEAFVNCYHAEVVVLDTEGKVTVQGREAFRKRYEKMFKRGGFSATVEKRVCFGDHCLDLEHWERKRDGEVVKGTVLVRYRLREGLIGTVQFLR